MTNANIITLEKEMNGKYINRSKELRGLIISLLTRSNIVLLGEPGTGKTDMIKCLSRHISGKCFQVLLNKTSTAEELFGAYDIKELEQGNYKRKLENTLVDSDVAFVDEVFKCNSEVLNSLLGVMADREFRNGQALPEQVKTQIIVGASNEMPDGGSDGELAALWDRFEMRYVVENIKTEDDFKLLLDESRRPEPTTNIDIKDIKEAYKKFKDIPYDDIISNLIAIKAELLLNHIKISDRRWRNSLKFLKCQAWLEGHTRVQFEDIKILADMFWNEPEQRDKVKDIIESNSIDKNKEDFENAMNLSNDLLQTAQYFCEEGKIIDSEDLEEISRKTKLALQMMKELKKRHVAKEMQEKLDGIKQELTEAYKKITEKVQKEADEDDE